MKRAKWKRGILCVLLLGIVLYLTGLIYCATVVSRMETLSYNAWGWGVVLAEYKLDFANDSVEVNYYDFDGTLMAHRKDKFSEEQQKEVRSACVASFMPLWRKRYINSSVADGDQWYIIADFGLKEKYVYGSNAYPLTYRNVYDKIRALADEIN